MPSSPIYTAVGHRLLEGRVSQEDREHHGAFLGADLELDTFAKGIRESGDCPGLAIHILELCSAGFGQRRDHVVEGDLVVGDRPLLVHGDLRVSGSLSIQSVVLVTGGVAAATIIDCGPDSFVAILGDLETRGLWTSGRFYVAGQIRAESLVCAVSSGDTLGAGRIETRVYMNRDDHPVECEDIAAETSVYLCPPHLYVDIADLFAHELYDARGDVDIPRALQLLNSDKCIFRSEDERRRSPLPLEQFNRWLEAHAGPQKQVLADIHASWLQRLSAFDRSDIETLLRRTIKSPKRKQELDSLLASISDLRSDEV